MKFFTALFVFLPASAWAFHDMEVCYFDDGDTVLEDYFPPKTITSEATIAGWYGFDGAVDWSANTPSGIEDANNQKVAFIGVEIQGVSPHTLSVAMILDQPNMPNPDSSGGSLSTKITCELDAGGDCAGWGGISFLAVRDDGSPAEGGTGNDKYCYHAMGDAIYARNHWNNCCTDGYAIVPQSECFTLCVEVLPKDYDIPCLSYDAQAPSGLNEVVYIQGGDDTEGSGSRYTIKDGAPEPGDKFCFKSCGGAKSFEDPHFKTFGNGMFDFMGACDLVLLEAPHFAVDAKLRINIRTTIRYEYSYIESAVVAIGDDFLEVSSYGDYAINGISNGELSDIHGFAIEHKSPLDKIHVFTIDLGSGEKLVVQTFKDMVSVKIDEIRGDRMKGARGMMGDAATGDMLARNGTITIEDPNAFAAEWQVRDNEDMLFMVKREPQYPAQCILPEVGTAQKRRLGQSVAREAAEKACAGWDNLTREGCIHDVMATGDLELAAAGAF